MSRLTSPMLWLLPITIAIGVITFAATLPLPRSSPLEEARARLARIESVRLLRHLDALRTESNLLLLRTDGRLLIANLSIPEEQRESVATLMTLLRQSPP